MIAKSVFFTGKRKLVFHVIEWIVIGLVLFSASVDTALGKALVLYDRLKIEPGVSFTETYNDNIYQTDTIEQDDFITSVIAGLDTQFAISPQVRCGLTYLGNFDFYKDSENFRKDHHYANARFQMDSAKGSKIEIGAWGEDTANPPETPEDLSKDYHNGALYTDITLSLAASTEFFGKYQYSSRRFDDDVDRLDDYDSNFFSLGLINSRNTLFPLLLEYRYETQENDREEPPTELTYQAAFAGFQWRQGHRLSGTLRGGYLWSEFNNENSYDGWATDTDLNYEISPFTTVAATAQRGVRESTRSARETLDYYIYAGGGLSFTYTRLDPVRLILFGSYENRDYRSVDETTDRREDDYYAVGLSARYRIRDWISLSLGYYHRDNDSNIDSFSYIDNRIIAEIILFSTEDILRLRLPKRSDLIRYF